MKETRSCGQAPSRAGAIKIYLDVREAPAPGEPIETTQARAQATLDTLASVLRERMRA